MIDEAVRVEFVQPDGHAAPLDVAGVTNTFGSGGLGAVAEGAANIAGMKRVAAGRSLAGSTRIGRTNAVGSPATAPHVVQCVPNVPAEAGVPDAPSLLSLALPASPSLGAVVECVCVSAT